MTRKKREKTMGKTRGKGHQHAECGTPTTDKSKTRGEACWRSKEASGKQVVTTTRVQLFAAAVQHFGVPNQTKTKQKRAFLAAFRDQHRRRSFSFVIDPTTTSKKANPTTTPATQIPPSTNKQR